MNKSHRSILNINFNLSYTSIISQYSFDEMFVQVYIFPFDYIYYGFKQN